MAFNYLAYFEEKSGTSLPDDHPLKLRLITIAEENQKAERLSQELSVALRLHTFFNNIPDSPSEQDIQMVIADLKSLLASPPSEQRTTQILNLLSLVFPKWEQITPLFRTYFLEAIDHIPPPDLNEVTYPLHYPDILIRLSLQNPNTDIFKSLGSSGPSILPPLIEAFETKTPNQPWYTTLQPTQAICLFTNLLRSQAQVASRNSLPSPHPADLSFLPTFEFLWENPFRAISKECIIQLIPVASSTLSLQALTFVLKHCPKNKANKVNLALWNWVRLAQFSAHPQIPPFLQELTKAYPLTEADLLSKSPFKQKLSTRYSLFSILVIFKASSIPDPRPDPTYFNSKITSLLTAAIELAASYNLSFDDLSHIVNHPLTQLHKVKPSTLLQLGAPLPLVLKSITQSPVDPNTWIHSLILCDGLPKATPLIDALYACVGTLSEADQLNSYIKLYQNPESSYLPKTSLQAVGYTFAKPDKAFCYLDLIKPLHYKFFAKPTILGRLSLALLTEPEAHRSFFPIFQEAIQTLKPLEVCELFHELIKPISTSTLPQRLEIHPYETLILNLIKLPNFAILFFGPPGTGKTQLNRPYRLNNGFHSPKTPLLSLVYTPFLLYHILSNPQDFPFEYQTESASPTLPSFIEAYKNLIISQASEAFYEDLLKLSISLWPADKPWDFLQHRFSADILNHFHTHPWIWSDPPPTLLHQLATMKEPHYQDMLKVLAANRVNLFTQFDSKTIFDILPEETSKALIDIYIQAHQAKHSADPDQSFSIELLLG